MHKSLLVLALIASACVVPPPETQEMKDTRVPVLPANPCETESATSCKYINAPVALQSRPVRIRDRPQPFFRTAREIEFVDTRPNKWIAPRNTLTDGASIPKMFFKLIGTPRSKEFINAATLHDAYCGVGNENQPQYHADIWQNVHRMFYDALRVDGTPPKRPKSCMPPSIWPVPAGICPAPRQKSGRFPGLWS